MILTVGYKTILRAKRAENFWSVQILQYNTIFIKMTKRTNVHVTKIKYKT